MTAAALVVLAFTVTAAALVVLAFAVTAAALVIFAFSMMVVVAVSTGIDKVASQVSFHCFIRIAGSSRTYLNTCIRKCVECASAQAAADQDLNVMSGQKACQRAVADPVRTDHFT